MRKLWQNQEVEHIKMSLEEIRSRARAYQLKIRLRNSMEYAAVAFIVIFFGLMIRGVQDTVMRLGDGLLIVGALYVAYQLHNRASAKAVPADTACVEFHRRELSRQLDFHRKIWSLYLAPLVPGIAVIIVAGAMANTGHVPHARLFITAYSCVCALAFFFVWWLNQVAARKIQRRIEELDARATES